MTKPLTIGVFGATGRLGGALRRIQTTHAMTFYDRYDVDFLDLEALAQFCRTGAWDILIVTTAMSDVDGCEANPQLAWTINASAPEVIARCAPSHTRVFYISTDFVFDGTSSTPYAEHDQPNPLNIYGSTKLAGERAVLAASANNTVIRTSWLFGGGKPSLPDIMIERAKTQRTIEVVADRWASPTSAADLAQALLRIAEQPPSHPIHHFCNTGVCTPFDYVSHAIQFARENGTPILADHVVPVDSIQSGVLKARRPRHSPMATALISSVLGAPPRNWRSALVEHIQQHHRPDGVHAPAREPDSAAALA